MLKRILIISFLLYFFPVLSHAGVQNCIEVKGFVVNVSSDGLLVVSIDHQAKIVRLAGVAYQIVNKIVDSDVRDFERKMVLNKKVRICCLGKDQLGNILGRVYFNDSCLNEALVQAGLAKAVP